MGDYDRYRRGKELESILEAYRHGEKSLEDAVCEILSATDVDEPATGCTDPTEYDHREV